MRTDSLNGGRVRPLTPHAIGVLRGLARGPVPSVEINPGVYDRFICEDLAESFEAQMPEHYKGKTRNIKWVRITEAGRLKLETLK